ncbi:helix-turn-helix domain-containing protein [Flavobacterium sp. ZT3R18]|uniref:AraC family transcriptional regulator n=1 Tax=Flavobacterium sp. ZT3R18 TaxID=2594429 RepID=UPI00117AF967|nr:helix-turn-helix domain-containing protein [Flavobacterium sp. ZT3R18]TRX35015.1 helix-turn-helix domain-containing protein [Flavobacterium sp. ZT3R18]
MEKTIPTYNINTLSGQKETNPDVFSIDWQINFENTPLNVPYRSNYFGVGFCLRGKATLKANLETYSVEQNSIVTMSPQIVKQWVSRSDDYQMISVFFTKEFLIQNIANTNFLDHFPFFEANATHVSKFSKPQYEIILGQLQGIQTKLSSTHPYKKEIVRSLITVLLFEMLALYNEHAFPSFFRQTRGGQITAEFKKIVSSNFLKKRNVKFYADLLFITPKHLTETIKAETGKSAGEWIGEIIILEAKVLLQDPTLTVADIANTLHFADQSTFGKFFKNIALLSPLAYRQTL